MIRRSPAMIVDNIQLYCHTMASQSWETIVQAKQAEATAKIPSAWHLPKEFTQNISEKASNNVLDVPRRCGILSPKQLGITENYDATALLEKIHTRKLSSYDVTEAFCIRAAIAQQVVGPHFPTPEMLRR